MFNRDSLEQLRLELAVVIMNLENLGRLTGQDLSYEQKQEIKKAADYIRNADKSIGLCVGSVKKEDLFNLRPVKRS